MAVAAQRIETPVRAMILAAGLGTRMRPLSDLRAKPALPVCGRPVISLLLELLAHHGIRDVLVNLHHRPDTIRRAVERDRPAELRVTWSEEPEPLGTGGGIRRAAAFLSETPHCLVLAGDMLLDLPLGVLFDRHVASGRDVTLVLRDDPRGEAFGTIGLDERGDVVRIGRRPLDRHDAARPSGAAVEKAAGLFTSVRFFRREALAAWPSADERPFEDLRDWLAPRAEAGALRFGGECVGPEASVWEPVGTPDEYLAANLAPPALPSLGGAAEHWRGDLDHEAWRAGRVVAGSAVLGSDVDLDRCVVWEDERVPAGFSGRDGVYAGGAFHACGSVRGATPLGRTAPPANPTRSES